MLRSRPQRSLFLLGLASAIVFLLAFTLPYWLPTHFLHVEDQSYSFTAREPGAASCSTWRWGRCLGSTAWPVVWPAGCRGRQAVGEAGAFTVTAAIAETSEAFKASEVAAVCQPALTLWVCRGYCPSS